jgi:coenzyme F420-0:L-glutamate ligase/coenzyme F420-1:gamma-L-glutamate ligase
MGLQPLAIRALPGIPEVEPGADLAGLIIHALTVAGLALAAGDVLVLAQKIVSKAEGRHVDLRGVVPSVRAREIATTVGKDPRFVETVLAESAEIVRVAGELLITRHRLGFVMANGGVDRSNLGRKSGSDFVLLLPRDPDASARKLRDAIRDRGGVAPAVIISDSFGRPWRRGVVNVALGVAGLPSIVNLRGTPDRDGRKMQTTEVAIADAIAAAAGLAMGEAGESTPVVHIRGIDCSGTHADGLALVRPLQEDLFR